MFRMSWWIFVICLSMAAGSVHAADSADLFRAVNGNDLQQVRAVIDERPDLVGSVSGGGLTALHISAARGYGDIALLLLEKGADVNARTINDSTPLAFALVNNHPEVARILEEAGGIQ